MGVIWIMNILLFITLYFNLLKRFINQLEKLKIPGLVTERLIPPWEVIK